MLFDGGIDAVECEDADGGFALRIKGEVAAEEQVAAKQPGECAIVRAADLAGLQPAGFCGFELFGREAFARGALDFFAEGGAEFLHVLSA